MNFRFFNLNNAGRSILFSLRLTGGADNCFFLMLINSILLLFRKINWTTTLIKTKIFSILCFYLSLYQLLKLLHWESNVEKNKLFVKFKCVAFWDNSSVRNIAFWDKMMILRVRFKFFKTTKTTIMTMMKFSLLFTLTNRDKASKLTINDLDFFMNFLIRKKKK